MSDLDPFADEEPWSDGRATTPSSPASSTEPDDLDDWARTRAQPAVQVPHELRARLARQQSLAPPTAAPPMAPPGRAPAPPAPPTPGPAPAPTARPLPHADPRRARHRSIRAAGPFVALLVPLFAAGLTALAWRGVSCDGSGCALPGAAGWATGAVAAPTAPVAGLPWQTSMPFIVAAGVSSLVVWFAVGSWAARRATAGPEATWGGFVRQLVRMALGMWLGVLAGLGAMAMVLLQT